MKWADNPEFDVNSSSSAASNEMSVQQALHIVAKESVLKLIIPKVRLFNPRGKAPIN